jgi:hypothetical protein
MLPGTPPAPTGIISGAQSPEISNLLRGYTYSHTSPPCTESVFVDASVQVNQNDTDFDPDMLTEQGSATR